MIKRIISLLATAAVALTGIAASAETARVDSADTHAVRFLTALGIMELDDDTGMFWDETPVKRSVMAEIICRLFDYEETADEIPKFTDVPEQDRACIETVVRNGYMLGYNSEEFGPSDYITGEQLVKIFVSLLGGDSVANTLGGYPSGYLQLAKRLGIISNIPISGAAARRIDVASIIYNTMNSDVLYLVSASGDGSRYDTTDGETFLTERLNIYRIEGVVEKNQATSLDVPHGAGEGMAQVDGMLLRDGDKIASNMLGCRAVVYYKKTDRDDVGNVIYAEESRDNKLADIDGSELNIEQTTDRDVVYTRNNKQKKLRLSAVADMIYNGKSTTLDMSRARRENCTIRLADNDRDGEYDVVIMNVYETYVTDRVNAADERILLRFGAAPIEASESFLSITRDGAPVGLSDIGMGEVILAAISDGTEERVIDIRVSTDTAVGSCERITSSDGDTYAIIGGERYKISAYARALADKGYIPRLSAGEVGRYFADANGAIAYYIYETSGERVGYLIDTSLQTEVFSASLDARIVTLDKRVEAFKASESVIVNGTKRRVEDIASDDTLSEKFRTAQLVLYRADDGVLQEISFASDGYNPLEFSLDIDRNIMCTNTSVLEDRFYTSAETVLFYVPNPSGITYDSIRFDPGKYHILTGSYFGQGSTYSLKLYDIAEDGFVKYAVYMRDFRWSQIGEGEPWLAVTGVSDGLGADGGDVKVLTAYNESGKEQSFEITDADMLECSVTAPDPEKGVMVATGEIRDVRAGDIVQYHLDSKGKIDEIKIFCSPEKGTEYFTPTQMTDSELCKTKVVYGEVMRSFSDHMLIACEGVTPDMTPLDADKYVANNGAAVYEFSFEKKKFYPISFNEIETGDKVFACVNGANKTRMLVVYR